MQKVSQQNPYNQQYEAQEFGMRTADMDSRRSTYQKQHSQYGQKQLKSQFWEESYGP